MESCDCNYDVVLLTMSMCSDIMNIPIILLLYASVYMDKDTLAGSKDNHKKYGENN